MIQIINEAIFSAIASAFGAGNLWKVIKGRFLQFIRGWAAISDIWKAETQKELDDAYASYVDDIEQIKGRYRQAETEFANNNSVLSSAYGDHLLFMHPGLAMTSALFEPLMNPTYRQDTRALMAYSGIDRFGLTPDFVKTWVDEQPDQERRLMRQTSTDDKGVTTTSDTFVYVPKDKSDKVSQIMSLFISENYDRQNPTLNENLSKSDAKKMAVKITKAYESEGIFDEMREIGKKILENKETLIAEVVTPSARTIKLLSDLLSSSYPEDFISTMDQIGKINPKLSGMEPGDFINQVDASVDQIKNDAAAFESIKADLKVDNIDDPTLREIVFISARNNFSSAIIESLENIYEKSIALLMEGITEKGLLAIKSTEIGKEYANLIESNIQILEDAIKSLEKIEPITEL